MAVIYTIKINEFSYKHEKVLRCWIPKDRLEKIDSYYLYEDYVRSIIGEGIVRWSAASLCGMKPEQLEIKRNKYGKPYFGNVENIHFNISHSNEWVACVISNCPCGIDIEKIGEVHLNIAKRCFTAKEYQMLVMAEKYEQKKLFYELWTLKESYVKYMGKGLSMPMNKFSFVKSGNKWRIEGQGETEYYFARVKTEETYMSYVYITDKIVEHRKLIM